MKTADGTEIEFDENNVTKEKFYCYKDLHQKPIFTNFKLDKAGYFISNDGDSNFNIFSSYKNCLKHMLNLSEINLIYYSERILKEQKNVKNLKMAIE